MSPSKIRRLHRCCRQSHHMMGRHQDHYRLHVAKAPAPRTYVRRSNPVLKRFIFEICLKFRRRLVF